MSLPPIDPNQQRRSLPPSSPASERQEGTTETHRRVFILDGFRYLNQLRKQLFQTIQHSLRRRTVAHQRPTEGYIPGSTGADRQVHVHKGAELGKGYEGTVFRAVADTPADGQSGNPDEQNSSELQGTPSKPLATRTSVVKEAPLPDVSTQGGRLRLQRVQREVEIQKTYPDAPRVFMDEQTTGLNPETRQSQGVYRVVMEDAGTGLDVLVHGKEEKDATGKVTFKLDGQPLDEKTFMHIASQLADTLDKAHQKGIIHRDIKPSNIMLDNQGKTRMIDFGMSLVAKENSDTDPVFKGISGTPEYMPPEMLDDKSYSLNADVWCLGITFAELLTGKKPRFQTFTRTSLGGPGEKQLDEAKREAYIQSVLDDKQLSQPVRDLLAGMLAVDPEKRLTAREVNESQVFVAHREAVRNKSETQAELDKTSQRNSLEKQRDKLLQVDLFLQREISRVQREIDILGDDDDDELENAPLLNESSSKRMAELLEKQSKLQAQRDSNSDKLQGLEIILGIDKTDKVWSLNMGPKS